MKTHLRVPILFASILIIIVLIIAGQGLASAEPGDPASPKALDFSKLFIDPDDANATTTQVQVDSSGGVHVAYNAQSSNNIGDFPAYYLYCAANCDIAGNWGLAEVGQLLILGGKTRLEVDSSNRPRMMWESWEPGGAVTGFFHYAECNTNCTNQANWSQVTLAEHGSTSQPSNYFALDQQGRPRFIYADNRYQHTGTFYSYCDSGCTNLANWHEIDIFSVETFRFSLEFTSTSQPRLGFVYSDYPDYNMFYAECDTACGDATNWDNTFLFQVGADSDLRLRLDSSNRPRLAFYTGYVGSGNATNYTLYYVGCNSNCLDYNQWDGVILEPPETEVKTLDMVLDSQNKPHLAFYADADLYGLVYTRCTANCDTVSGTWESDWVDTSDDLDASNPVPPAPGCTLSSWYPGKKPSIALRAGFPVIAYDAEHIQGGTCPPYTDILLPRIALGFDAAGGTPTATLPPGVTPTPIPPGNQRVYLPMLQR